MNERSEQTATDPVASTALLGLLADIRAAVGDPNGRLMQEELVEHCRRVTNAANKAEALAEREHREARGAASPACWQSSFSLEDGADWGFPHHDKVVVWGDKLGVHEIFVPANAEPTHPADNA